MFEVARKLFGIVVRPAASAPQVWHPDAMFFEILDDTENVCAQFYLDVYARANKRGGAWMADCIGRYRKLDGSLQTPVALLTSNFAPPVDDKPSLLTHEDVLLCVPAGDRHGAGSSRAHVLQFRTVPPSGFLVTAPDPLSRQWP